MLLNANAAHFCEVYFSDIGPVQENGLKIKKSGSVGINHNDIHNV